MCRIFVFLLVTISSFCSAQKVELDVLLKSYSNIIDLPIKVQDLVEEDSVNNEILNKLLFDLQLDRAYVYFDSTKLVRITDYGRVNEEPFVYEAWKKENDQIVWFDKSFETKAYSLGRLDLNPEFHVIATKIVGFEKTYVDLYVFNREGKLMSLVNLYEFDYKKNGEPNKMNTTYIQSSITEKGIIKWQESRFSVQTLREYQLQSDGYFKIIKQSSEGEFEY